ncbi:ankyrin protein [Fusarium bulbicola]|nr:ankyrin protein [Fusarium bulbicola]
MSDSSDPDSYTVGWVCALSTEFTAAQEQFDEEYEPHESPEHREANDFNVYSFGKIKGHMVVVAVLPNGQYGTASASTVAKDMIRSFRNIRFGLMVGIGGGAPTKDHDIRLGDVVVSSPTPSQGGVFQYDLGNATEDGFQHTASHNKPPPLLLAAVAGLKTQYERKGLQIHDKTSTIISNNKRLRAKYGRPKDPDSLFAVSVKHKGHPCHELCVKTPDDLIPRTPRQEPLEDIEVHYGTIASGNTLMKDAAKRDELASRQNILCFEMEAAGLMDGFRCLVIRGICDYSDSHKNDQWQGYAAMTAAVYAKQILGMVRPEAVTREETIVSRIDEVISGVQDLERSIVEQEVLDWLSDEDFGAYQFDEQSKKAPGTCEWFLDSPEYQFWTQEKNHVLFCPGIAGAGKTVLASAIIENLHSRFETDSDTATVHIYCRYNRVDRQTCDRLRASLLRQLCERMSPLPASIMQLYGQYKPRRVEVPPERIISELESVSGLFSRIFMVVDALDEWATEHGDLYSLPAELLLIQRKLAINLLATSRQIPLISNQFKNCPSISITAQQQDIHTYVDNFRWPESSCIGRIPKLRDLVRRTMSQIVRGMFLLARLYLHSLANETSERDVKDALKQFEDRAKNNDHDPKFSIVDQAYNDTLKRLREQHQNSSDLAFRVIAWICCTRWKLPANAIQQGLALREGDTTFDEDGIVDEQLLVSVCCGLVEISERSREMRLAHYTTESFFRHNQHLIDEYFLVRHSLDSQLPSNADAYLARQCVACLSIGMSSFFEGAWGDVLRCRTNASNSFIFSLDHEERERIECELNCRTHSLYEYSIFNWGNHVRQLSPLRQTYRTSTDFLQACGMMEQAVIRILTDEKSSEAKVSREMVDLHLAALFGLRIKTAHRRVVKALLSSGANPHIPGYNGDTPLHLAATLGDVEIVQNLLGYGVDTHTSNSHGYIPLVLAVRYGKESTYMKLLERGAVDVCGKNSRTALIEAASVGDLALVKALLGKGAKVDISDITGQTALMEASKRGHIQIVELLLENQFNVDHQDHKGETALMKACMGDHANVIEMLLAANAQLGIEDAKGKTALANAGRHCGEGNIKRLLHHSRDPAIRYQYSCIVLIFANMWKRRDIVSLILDDTEFELSPDKIDSAFLGSCYCKKAGRLSINQGANLGKVRPSALHYIMLLKGMAMYGTRWVWGD